MSTPKMISPMLDNFMVGDAINEREGLCTYPAMRQQTEEKYILKVISVPSSPSKLDALLLSGAYPNEEAALSYYRELAGEIEGEIQLLNQLAELEGYFGFEKCQIVEKEDHKGYDVYLLSPYKRSLDRYVAATPLTHLSAANLGLDLCAALTMARRAGYIYADLRPDNVYVTADGGFKLGDIGFIRLDDIQYAALPERYRSQYTAPEALDPYASPSDTQDVYALGLILYQAFNNNMLPVATDGEAIAAPQYADYEMAEIILKACAANPEDRWQTPVELGQAIVSYMQRNGINDTPIIPVAEAEPEPELPEIPESEEPEQSAPEATDESEEAAVTSTEAVEIEQPEENASFEYIEDDFGNLSFLDDVFTDPYEDLPTYDQVSGEVSEMLVQADDLVAHAVPEPVVAPEAIEVPIPVPEEESPENLEETKAVPVPVQDIETVPEEQVSDEPVEENEDAEPPKKKSRWLRNTIIILAILALLACGVFFFLKYYFVSVNNLRVEGREDKLIVHVDADIDDAKLKVECSYPEGTPIFANVVDGKAVFEGLSHDTDYTIVVHVEGLHKLTGELTTRYTSPELTTLLDFSAKTGTKDGSMILSFSVNGPESEEWTVTYWTDGEPEQTVTFQKSPVTLENLTVGKTYTIQLAPTDDLYVDGDWMIQATASKLILAQNIVITEFKDSKLSASWTAPEGAQVNSWTVFCQNGQGFSKAVVVNETSVTFPDVDCTMTYTIEITAEGMSKSAKPVEAIGNSINISNVSVTLQSNRLLLSWEADRELPDGSWIAYTVDDGEEVKINISGNSVSVADYVPGAKYVFTMHTPDNTGIAGMPYVYGTNGASN